MRRGREGKDDKEEEEEGGGRRKSRTFWLFGDFLVSVLSQCFFTPLGVLLVMETPKDELLFTVLEI